MLKIIRNSAFTLFAATFASLPALAADEQIPANEHAAALKRVEQQVVERTLSNGIRVLFYRRGIAPTFAGAVVVRVGGSDEKPGHTGISHLFEHMAFKGTSTIGTRDWSTEKPLLARLEELAVPAAEQGRALTTTEQKEWDSIEQQLRNLWESDAFTRVFEKAGASGMNATTDTETTNYFVNLPRSAFDLWLEMESARLLDPVMRQFYQERDVVLEERRMRTDDSPNGKLYEALLGTAFTTHPYRYPVIGHERDIRRITATDVENFRRLYYTPENIVLALVGDVDPETDLPAIERHFGGLPLSTNAAPRPSEVEPAQRAERRVTVTFPAEPIQFLAYHKPVFPDPEDAAFSVMSEVLTGTSSAPLYDELVKKSRMAASVETAEVPGSLYPNLLVFSLVPKAPFSNQELRRAFDRVISQFIRTGPTAEQLQVAQRALSVQYLARLKSNSTIAVELATVEALYHDFGVLFRWFEAINRVTPEQVRAVAAKYLVAQNRTVAQLERGTVVAVKR